MPILINLLVMVNNHGVRLCRPSERVLDLLDTPVTRFTKEDREVITYPEES